MDRNPSPPPEIINNADFFPDKIGDTVYSKIWIYKTLMSIFEYCDKSSEVQCSEEAGKAKSDNEEKMEETEIKNEIVELDPHIEEIACILWDMSADKDVAEFLLSTTFLSMLVDIIEETKSPRLLEIVLGVLGNLSSFDSVCEEISKKTNLLHSVLILTGTSDTPTLVQVLRVILCGVLCEKSLNNWIIVIKDNSSCIENVKFILENCLNEEVLKLIFHILYLILQEEESFCESWGGDANIRILIEAGKQLKTKQEPLENFLCLFYVLWQYPPSKISIESMFADLQTLFESFFGSLKNVQDQPPVTVVNACYELYNEMLESNNTDKESYKVGSQMLKSFVSMYEVIGSSLSSLNSSDEVSKSWKSLQKTVLHTLAVVYTYVEESDIQIVETILKNSEMNGTSESS